MSNSVTLSDLRNYIDGINREMMRERGSGEVSNAEILKRLHNERQEEINFLAPKLIEAALIKLLNDACGRKIGKAFGDNNVDLFGDYPGIQTALSFTKGKKKLLAKATYAEMQLWVDSHAAKALAEKNKPYKLLLEACSPYVQSGDDTIEDLMSRKREAERLTGT